MTLSTVVLGNVGKAGRAGRGAAFAGAEAAGATAAEAETVGPATAGAATGPFATREAGCFRVKKKIVAHRIIAAATRISVVELNLVGCFGEDAEDSTLPAGAESSAAATVAPWGDRSCGSRGVVGILPCGKILGETLPGDATTGGTLSVGIVFDGASLIGAWLGGAWVGGAWTVFACGGSGALGRGT